MVGQHFIACRDILGLLLKLTICVVESYSGGAGGSDVSLSIDAVEALGFLIEGSVDRNRYLLCKQN